MNVSFIHNRIIEKTGFKGLLGSLWGLRLYVLSEHVKSQAAVLNPHTRGRTNSLSWKDFIVSHSAVHMKSDENRRATSPNPWLNSHLHTAGLRSVWMWDRLIWKFTETVRLRPPNADRLPVELLWRSTMTPWATSKSQQTQNQNSEHAKVNEMQSVNEPILITAKIDGFFCFSVVAPEQPRTNQVTVNCSLFMCSFNPLASG